MIATVQLVVLLALYLAVFVMCVVALADAARRPASAFTTSGKRTKGFWLVVLGIATAVAFVALPFGGGGMGFFIAGIAAAAAGVYLADVRPAIDPYSGRGRGGRGRGGRGPRRPGSGGGW